MELQKTGERLVTSVHNQTMVEHLHRYAFAEFFTAGKVVLDIACGEGYGTNLLSKKAKFIYGVDISNEAVNHASKKYNKDNIEFILGSAFDIPLVDESVDVVVSFETIEHHNKHDEMIKECKRVLRPEGILVISTPDKKYYTDIPGTNNSFHVKELYKNEFKELLQKYFANSLLFNQGVVSGSIIYNENLSEKKPVELFTGTYKELHKIDNIASPVYNIIVASNYLIESYCNTFFESVYANSDLHNKIQILEKRYERLNNSNTYKLAKLFMLPAVLSKKLVQFVKSKRTNFV